MRHEDWRTGALERSVVCLMIVVFLLASHLHCQELPSFSSDGLSVECSARPGDLLLGFLTMFRSQGPDDQHRCSNDITFSFAMQLVEAFSFVISEVNARSDILNNITLGYVILDTCFSSSPLGSLGRAQYFIGNHTEITDQACFNGVDKFKVAGVIGPLTSTEAVLTASILGFHQIPSIGFVSTSDELTRDSQFEYFLRVAPPDRHQAEAILDFVSHFNWTYISLVYTLDNYGANGAKNIEAGVKRRGMCFGVTASISMDASKMEIDSVFKQLVQNSKARVVILFLQSSPLKLFFTFLQSRQYSKYFIFIASDAAGFLNSDILPSSLIGIHFIDSAYPEFDRHYQSLSLQNASAEHWMKMEIARLHDCSWDVRNVTKPCSKYVDRPFINDSIALYNYMLIDGIFTMVYALDELVKSKCPSAAWDKSMLNSCITGPELLKLALNISFEGASGHIEFDVYGDIKGQYDIKQFRDNTWLHVVTWLQNDGLVWNKIIDDIFTGHVKDGSIPESVCSQPCEGNTYIVHKDISCCWDCQMCRPYEVPNHNRTSCYICPFNTWPDRNHGTTCLAIPPDYIMWADSLAIALATMATIGLICCLLVALLFLKQKCNKLIKASCREVMGIILFGIDLAFANIFLFITKPDNSICYVQLTCFHLSVTLIYAPLLVKTNRLYRIFTSGKQGIMKPKYIGTRMQLGFIGALLASQVRYSTCSILYF